jgi:hypothetical protein
MMSNRARLTAAAMLGIAMIACSVPAAKASYVVTIQQEGPDIVATGSGTIKLTGGDVALFGTNVGSFSSGLLGFYEIYTGTPNTDLDAYIITTTTGFTLSPVGAGTLSGAGDFVGLNTSAPEGLTVYVPAGYVSGNSLSSTSTFTDVSFASLDIAPETFTWSWGSGDDADSITLNILAVPEPGTSLLFALSATVTLMVRLGRINPLTRELPLRSGILPAPAHPALSLSHPRWSLREA